MRCILVLPFAIVCTAGAGQAPRAYTDLVARIEVERRKFAEQGADRHGTGLDDARRYLVTQMTDSILPAWYGTPWDFNGTTRIPGAGAIACGYFVNTTLQDAGFRIPRIRWSQLAAEPMIRKLAPQARSFSNASVADVQHWLIAQGDGVFVVGLDNHVGFITLSKGHARFVHSNYYQPRIGVMAECLDGPNPFAASRYRVIGKLFSDEMTRAWIQGATYH